MNMTQWYWANIGSKLETGYFVEIGVYNGITQNSTIILERNGWDGVLVEPMPGNIKKIKKNRKTRLVEGACWSYDGYVLFADTGVGGQSGVVETHFKPEEIKRKFKVKAYKFSSLDTPKHINYLQLDCEGAELEVLKTIDLDEYQIDHICIEDYLDTRKGIDTYHQFMTKLGYEEIHRMEQDRLYVKK